MRTELIESFNTWLQVPPEELAIITKVVTMLHTSSLLSVFLLRVSGPVHCVSEKTLTLTLSLNVVSMTLKTTLSCAEGSQVNWDQLRNGCYSRNPVRLTWPNVA
jgi:hypothetical protein